MKTTAAVLFALLLPLLPLGAQAAESAAPGTPRLETLLAELMANVDLALLIRIQQTLVENIDLIGPYSQEYFNCLKAEGAFDSEAPLDLKGLVIEARKTGGTCQVILESLFGQMKFDITPEEFEQGLSPEYRELLHKSL